MELELTQLKKDIKGEVVLPGDKDYEVLSKVLMAKGTPAVIVKPADNNDVAAAISFARENKLVLSVKSGGHSGMGASTNNGGLVIDLALLNSVEVIDEEKSLVRIGTGAIWGDVARSLMPHKLAISSGDTASVGVGGIGVGGGIGWMVRQYGLVLDNIVSADIVTAEGQLVHTSEEENADLFWAIRGAGANFGVVTSIVVKAHPCDGIVGGTINYDIKDFKNVLTGWVKTMRAATHELNSMLMVFPGFDPSAKPQIINMFCFDGSDKAAADKAIAPFLEIGSVMSQDYKAKPYVDMLEEAHDMGPIKVRVRNGFIPEFSDEALDVLAEQYGDGKTVLQLRFLGGAVDEVPADAMAFSHRGNEGLLIMPTFSAPNTSDEDADAAADKAWSAIKPYVAGAYGNFFTDKSEASVALAYPKETLERLTELKKTYDPENLFDHNVNILPR
jgi:FAD/FMN-containing dehydrogenase